MKFSQPVFPRSLGKASRQIVLKLPLSHYKGQNIVDIFSKGFRNVKLRSRADLYVSPCDTINFTWFPRNLTINVWRGADHFLEQSRSGGTREGL